MVVYGPYDRHDGRVTVVLYYPTTGRRTSMSYPKWLKEQELGYLLGIDDTIDHHDRNITNNDHRNLKVLPRAEHAKLDCTRALLVEQECLWCGKTLVRHGNDIRYNAKKGKAGPFCKQCAGKYGSMIQNGTIERLPAQEAVVSQYYKRNKDR